jgi:mannose-6-phosphate isomerase-like protein (cupin superfamily)
MPVIDDDNAPRFDLGGTHVVGLAAPSRGARDTSVWRLRLDPGSSSPPHALDREEVFVAISGAATAAFADHTETVRAGGALIVPAGQEFSISTEGVEPFEAIACLPVGASATVAGEASVPPWAA